MPTPVPARSRGGSLEDLRRANRRLILGHLLSEGPRSRAELARATGLSATTVSSLVNEMLGSGQLRETATGRPHKGGSGRPPVLVELATPPGGVVGVDIGHGHVRVAANLSSISEFLPGDLQTFRDKYPLIQVHVEEKVSTAAVVAVTQNAADVGLIVQGPRTAGLNISWSAWS